MCIAAATGYVKTTLAATGVAEIVDFDFVPWGNAYYSKVTGNTTYDRGPGMTAWLEKCGMGVSNPPAGCFEGPILCQHGANECKGNLIEGCVKSVLKNVAADYWPFMACFEGQDIDRIHPDSPIKAMDVCVAKAGISRAVVKAAKACMDDPDEAHKVSSENAKKTAALVPAHEGTPWILINGKSFSGGSLLTAVCNAYSGTTPAGCSSTHLALSDLTHTATALAAHRC